MIRWLSSSLEPLLDHLLHLVEAFVDHEVLRSQLTPDFFDFSHEVLLLLGEHLDPADPLAIIRVSASLRSQNESVNVKWVALLLAAAEEDLEEETLEHTEVVEYINLRLNIGGLLRGLYPVVII